MTFLNVKTNSLFCFQTNYENMYHDNYEHIDPDVEYILENQIYISDEDDDAEELTELEDNLTYCLSKFCNCLGDTNCSDLLTCFHGSNYKSIVNAEDGTEELILNEDRPCADLIYECSSLCSCTASCQNRLVQYGPRNNLKIVQITKGDVLQFGLTTKVPIKKGAFVCEYIGEILTKKQALRRHQRNDQNNRMNYIICLNEMSFKGANDVIQTFIDPSSKGNIGRYLNHSCQPNCEILSVRVDSVVPRLGIFARTDINAGDELCFDYGSDGKQPDESITCGKSCFCESKNCRKYLPSCGF